MPYWKVAVRVLVGTLLLVLVASTQAALSAQHRTTQPQSYNCVVTLPPARPDTRGTANAPLSVRVVQMPLAPEPPKDRSGWVIAVATFILAGITAALAFFTLRLWRSTSKLVSGADATARHQLRAYVTPTEFQFINPIFLGDVKVTICNFGETPAYKFRVSAQLAFGRTFADAPPLEESTTVLGHLAPGAVHQMSLKARALNTALSQLPTAELLVFLYGIVRYVDAFKEEHWTRFRLQSTGGPFKSCGEGNDTDDDARLT